MIVTTPPSLPPSPDAQTSVSLSPLHVASSCGYVAVIVALVEEGGADLDQQAGEAGDTPLMLSVGGACSYRHCLHVQGLIYKHREYIHVYIHIGMIV